MANYTSHWTSSKDREFQQIKKVKQLTERHLAMNVAEMEIKHKRSMKKVRAEIRESMVVLEDLEKEKETRARHILATYLKHRRRQQAVAKWIFHHQLGKQRNSVQLPPPTLAALAARSPSPSQVSSQDMVQASPTSLQLPALTPPVPAHQRSRGGHSPQNTGQLDRSLVRREGGVTRTDGPLSPAPSVTRPSQYAMRQENKATTATSTNAGRVFMTQTFPYVYHSHGEKPCPRYSLFRECTDYNPYSPTSSSPRRESKMADTLSQEEHTRDENQRKSSSRLKKVALTIQIVNAMSKREEQGDSIPEDSEK